MNLHNWKTIPFPPHAFPPCGSTVTLNNDVPIHVVKELLGHQSVKQTEEYAITEQQSVGREMKQLQMRLSTKETTPEPPSPDIISKMQQEIQERKELLALSHGNTHLKKV